ncbi:LeoA/HP0731 family dynamin-like GTPase [Oceanobacillus massiliensis]|uniref:LeoA/HP0731 family dynamin-like GTPase n=1 Tax=Oceanobacillus massiliensis TaxID=1465765 RepID=UPI003015CCDB
METIDYFKQQQIRTIEILERLLEFLNGGQKFGIVLNEEITKKIEVGINKIASDKLKVALVGGFSEGKTSIAAAWSESYDTSTMKISQTESTDEVNIYEMDNFELIDTPGLFGFKETEEREKYNDITKKYVSEANLVIYVMNPNNPIKESHKDVLIWLFKDLNLLPRTVFVISRFDEEVDLEDEDDFNERFHTKRENIISRLHDFGIIQVEQEASIVAVSANPFGEGIDYWLSNLDEYKKISHISDLQVATTQKIKESGGKNSLVVASQQSIVRDVIIREMPVARERVAKATEEIEKFKSAFMDIQRELNKSERKISNVRIDLRNFITEYFTDLILQVKGTNLDTIEAFFERNIGEEGVVLDTNIQNEFESQLGKMVQEISQVEMSFNSSINHYNHIVGDIALNGMKVGGEFLKKGGVQVTNTKVLAARDLLMPSMKFKPWGAVKIAERASKGFALFGAVLGIGVEAWDSWNERKKKQEFQNLIERTVQNFNKQRQEYLDFINDNEKFINELFPDYIELINRVAAMGEEVDKRENFQREFEEWQHQGAIVEADFELLS